MSHEFIGFASAHGLNIDPAKLYPSDRIRRCGTVEKPRSTNGAYFWDGERGWVFDWAGERDVKWFSDPHARAWTQAEKEAWAAKRRAAAWAQQQAYHRAAQRAAEMLRDAELLQHDYLHRKGFPAEKGFVLDGTLLVPMRNVITNEIQSVQRIDWDASGMKFEKKMLYGGKAECAVLRLGDKRASDTFLCEGYATGLSVHAALRSVGLNTSVVVCFSDRNMVRVAPQITGCVRVFADNDASGAGERAARETGLPYCMSEVIGEDANDLHQRTGLFAVAAKVMEARRMTM